MFSTRVKWKMWSNYSLLPFRQVSQHSPERQCAAKKKKVSFFFFFRPVKTLSLDFLIHLICINIAGWHQQFNHLINLDLSIYADQHKLRHLENGLQAVGSMRWTGSKCMFRTAARAKPAATARYTKVKRRTALFSQPWFEYCSHTFSFCLMKYPLHYNTGDCPEFL